MATVQRTIGYHGTNERSARRIAEEGFLAEFCGDFAYFATAGRLLVAKTHGRGRALALGELEFCVVRAAIPTELIDPEFGQLDVRVSTAQTEQIEVLGIDAFPLNHLY